MLSKISVRALLALLCLSAPSTSLLAEPLEFPEENAFMATIAGTPRHLMASVPHELEVRQEDMAVRVLPERVLPPVLRRFRDLQYRLAWQEQPAPLMFLIAGTGSGFDTTRMDYLKRVFWQAGMHVIVLSSPTNYDFLAAASQTGLPGLGYQDARDLHRAMAMAVGQAQQQKNLQITGYHMAGFSLGALNAAFVGELDSHLEHFNFDSILLMNPPVDLLTSVNRLDRLAYTEVPGVDGTDSFYEHIFGKLSAYFATAGLTSINEGLFYDIQNSEAALSDADMAMLVAAVFRFAAADLNFMADLITQGGLYAPPDEDLRISTSLTPYLRRAMFCNFSCYVETQLWPAWQERNPGRSKADMAWRTSLESIQPYLRDNPRIAVVTNADDFILSRENYYFLAETFGERAYLYPRGGHGGNLQHKDVVARMLAFVQGGHGQ